MHLPNMTCPGLEIEKKYDLPIFFGGKIPYNLSFIFLPAKNGEVSYVVEMNVFMMGIYF